MANKELTGERIMPNDRSICPGCYCEDCYCKDELPASNDPCKCGVGDEEGLRIDYDFVAGDGIVIHDPGKKGCGKYMRYWNRD
jgi:hypothetical protein